MGDLIIALSDDAWQSRRDAKDEFPREPRETLIHLSGLNSYIGDALRGSRKAAPEISVRTFSALGFAVVDVPDIVYEETLDALRSAKDLAAAEPTSAFDLILPDEGFQEMDALGEPYWNLALTHVYDLRAKKVTGKGVLVAVLDSGVDLNVAQLQGKVESHATFDASGREVDQAMDDSIGHGTHVCGIVAGEGFGVAPDARLAVGRIAPEGRSTFPQMLAGLNWICERFPRVRAINMSVGKVDNPTAELVRLVDRLAQLNKLLICSIGNDGPQTSRTPGNLRQALGVGAVNQAKQVWLKSGGMTREDSEGPYVKPDLVMPGVNVPSCIPGGKVVTGSGTSQAAPMLTGLAALILQEHPDLTVAELRARLLASCETLPEPPDRDGAGLPIATRLPP
ncbi:MAG: hypothetical protein FJ118_20435 [Deltaproteobacteria bacterium]|nr:hypothetical protein [Deltaproteobacteria bacterium]